MINNDFVDAVVAGNNIEAEKVFKNNISSKVGDALEVKRKDYASTFVSNVSKEEADGVW